VGGLLLHGVDPAGDTGWHLSIIYRWRRPVDGDTRHAELLMMKMKIKMIKMSLAAASGNHDDGHSQSLYPTQCLYTVSCANTDN